MTTDITEADWRAFKTIKAAALLTPDDLSRLSATVREQIRWPEDGN